MTNEEAIKRLEAELEDYKPFIEKFEGAKSDCEALEMAIKSMDKLEKIKQIANEWNDVPWGNTERVIQTALIRIADVLEKE